ncbi:MAG: metal ABC transporter permease [Planctomycetaceae bacterium]|nr:metal ABC transporter permease [Planctomycetaceae bacterium]
MRFCSCARGLAVLTLLFAWYSPSNALALSREADPFPADVLRSITAAGGIIGDETPSLTHQAIEWPTWQQWKRLFTLSDYNTRVVVLGTMLLGMAAGAVGSFTLLRRRSLMGDALSHATLPGVGLAFIFASTLGRDGKSLPVLLAGAVFSGLLGVVAILFVRRYTRLKEDAAMGIVLSVFFGAGIAVLSIVQQMPEGHAAGLEAFIYGKTASMVASDAWLIGISGLLCVLLAYAVFKELTLLCFDDQYAGARGFPVLALDIVLMTMVVVVTIIGLQAVGQILMIALLVIPAAAARFWTQNIRQMTVISSAIGSVSGLIGSAMSAIFPGLPSGAMIVLVSGVLFLFSMFGGSSRGVLIRLFRRWQLNQNIDRQHLLRGLYEFIEQTLQRDPTEKELLQSVPFSDILSMRSWSPGRLQRQINRCRRHGTVSQSSVQAVALTTDGIHEAARLVHEHRLWEMYLITHAEVAPSRVDRDADAIEHVLEPEMIQQLEELLEQSRPVHGVPQSPHPITQAGAAEPVPTPSHDSGPLSGESVS